jgi:acyl-CoA dehydrogenase
MGLTAARYTDVPADERTRRFYQQINRYSASFALAADAAMLTLGGGLKRRELLSARLGDVLSYLYLTSMVLKHYRNQGEPEEDFPVVEWACRTLLYRAQEQLHGLLRNLPNRIVAGALRVLIFPRGRTFSSPSDETGQQVVELIINDTPTRERLADCIYRTPDPDNQVGLLQQALVAAETVKPLERRIHDARKRGEIHADDTPGQIEEAEAKGILTHGEAQELRRFDELVMELTGVDDFDPSELPRLSAPVPDGATGEQSAPNPEA